MDKDFSHLNLEYLIQARDLAKADPGAGGILLGLPDRLVGLLARAKGAAIAHAADVRLPLVVPRGDQRWWQEFFQALQDGNSDEIDFMIDRLGLSVGRDRSRN